MTIEEIDELPWARSTNLPRGWDFRNKTAIHLEPLQFGAYVHSEDPSKCKLVYGGRRKAEVAVRELEALGIEATLEAPRDSLLGDDGETVLIKGWSYNVHFRLNG